MEAPHLYKIGEYYYLLNAEGGTEYGHMVNYARAKNIKGPYEPFPQNPVLTNRNMGGYQLQGAGHGDILQTSDGNWWFCHLAFRQIDKYMPFHHLGRETCIEPVTWNDGWFYTGTEYDKAADTFYGEKTANGYNHKIIRLKNRKFHTKKHSKQQIQNLTGVFCAILKWKTTIFHKKNSY